jgi:hypothetical protein
MPSEAQRDRLVIDIVYLAKGRSEYTAASLQSLIENTNWGLVRNLVVYSDGTEFPWIDAAPAPAWLTVRAQLVGGPVNAMLDYLAASPADVWAKIDNDVILPPGWLDACCATMQKHPELDLLGIEPPLSRTPAPWTATPEPAPESKHKPGDYSAYAPCRSIGGIGLFRTRAWIPKEAATVDVHRIMRQHSIYGGFTDWQESSGVTKGWVVPPLQVFLLDRLPWEPWASLGRRYIAEGIQRPWTMYSEATAEALAGHWRDEMVRRMKPR